MTITTNGLFAISPMLMVQFKPNFRKTYMLTLVIILKFKIVKVQIVIFECTCIIGQDLVHPYIQSTTVLCDTVSKILCQQYINMYCARLLILSSSNNYTPKEQNSSHTLTYMIIRPAPSLQYRCTAGTKF